MTARKNLLATVSNVFKKELANYNFDLFVFGSQANKKELIAADIDLGVMATQTIAPALLHKIKRELNDELQSLYTFDVVDFGKVDTEFANVAMQNIEYLCYAKKPNLK